MQILPEYQSNLEHWANVGQADECWLFKMKNFVASKCGRIIYGRVYYKSKRYRAHRLIAKMCGKDVTGMMVCHKCDNPLCLNPAHLFLGTAAENMADKMAKGRHRAPIGEANGQAKLTEWQASEVRRRALAGENQRVIAKEFGITQPNVSAIKTGKSYCGTGRTL